MMIYLSYLLLLIILLNQILDTYQLDPSIAKPRTKNIINNFKKHLRESKYDTICIFGIEQSIGQDLASKLFLKGFKIIGFYRQNEFSNTKYQKLLNLIEKDFNFYYVNRGYDFFQSNSTSNSSTPPSSFSTSSYSSSNSTFYTEKFQIFPFGSNHTSILSENIPNYMIYLPDFNSNNEINLKKSYQEIFSMYKLIQLITKINNKINKITNYSTIIPYFLSSYHVYGLNTIEEMRKHNNLPSYHELRDSIKEDISSIINDSSNKKNLSKESITSKRSLRSSSSAMSLLTSSVFNPPSNLSQLGINYLKLERYFQELAEKYSIKTFNLRLFPVLGLTEKNIDHDIQFIMKQLITYKENSSKSSSLDDNKLPLITTTLCLNSVYDFIHINDVASAVGSLLKFSHSLLTHPLLSSSALSTPFSPSLNSTTPISIGPQLPNYYFESYNIGSGRPQEYKKILDILYENIGIKLELNKNLINIYDKKLIDKYYINNKNNNWLIEGNKLLNNNNYQKYLNNINNNYNECSNPYSYVSNIEKLGDIIGGFVTYKYDFLLKQEMKQWEKYLKNN